MSEKDIRSQPQYAKGAYIAKHGADGADALQGIGQQ
jgi:hypothetical protein